MAGKGGEFLGGWDLRYEVGCVRTKVESHQEEDAHTCTPLTVLILNAFSVNPKIVFLFFKKKKTHDLKSITIISLSNSWDNSSYPAK